MEQPTRAGSFLQIYRIRKQSTRKNLQVQAPFYRFISDPVSDPVLDPVSDPVSDPDWKVKYMEQ
jgi:hypothetical protein